MQDCDRWADDRGGGRGRSVAAARRAHHQGRRGAHVDDQRGEGPPSDRAALAAEEEKAREHRNQATEAAEVAIQKQKLESRLTLLEVDKDDAFASAAQEKAVAEEQARVLTEKQLFLLEQRWQVEQEEIQKELSVEQAQIDKESQVLLDSQKKETAEVQRSLTRQQEERNREIALTAKQMELEQAEAKRLEATAARQRAEHEAESVRHVADAERQRIIDLIEAENSAQTRRVEEENKGNPGSSERFFQENGSLLEQVCGRDGAASLHRTQAVYRGQS